MHCVWASWLATFMCVGVRRKVEKVHLIVFSVPETICEKHSKVASCLQECLYTVNNPRVQWSELLHWWEIIVDLLYTNSLSNHLAVLKTLCHQIFHFTSANPDCRATSRSYMAKVFFLCYCGSLSSWKDEISSSSPGHISSVPWRMWVESGCECDCMLWWSSWDF